MLLERFTFSSSTSKSWSVSDSGFDDFSFQLVGSGSMTIVAEGTLDGTNWVSLQLYQGSVAVSGASTAGVYSFSGAFCSSVRLRVSSYSSSSFDVSISRTNGLGAPAGPAGPQGATGPQIILHPAYLNGEVKLLQVKALASGDNDLGTPPAGKKWVVVSAHCINPTGSGSLATALRKVGGVYYKLSAATSIGAGSFAAIPYGSYIFESGDTVGINATINFACNLYIIEFDATSPLKSVASLSLTNGNNTIYTCPSGYSASPVTIGGPGSLAQGAVFYQNSSGGSRSVYINFVRSGDTPTAQGASSNTNIQIPAAQTVANNAVGPTNAFCYPFEAGDYLNFNTNASGGWAWTTIVEVPL